MVRSCEFYVGREDKGSGYSRSRDWGPRTVELFTGEWTAPQNLDPEAVELG